MLFGGEFVQIHQESLSILFHSAFDTQPDCRVPFFRKEIRLFLRVIHGGEKSEQRPETHSETVV